jgi:hypothetical protein
VQDGGEDEGKELLDRAKADMLAKLDAIERRQREADAAVAGVLTELNAGNGDGNGMNPMLDRSSHRPRG